MSLFHIEKLLSEVLNQFDVTFVWNKRTDIVIAVDIFYGHQKFTYTYVHTPIAEANCRMALRHFIHSKNIPSRQPATPIAPNDDSNVPLSVPTMANKSINPVAIEPPDWKEPERILQEPMMAEPSPPPEDDHEINKQEANFDVTASTAQSQTVLIEPNEVVMIEMTSDITIPKGHLLIIPLHAPEMFVTMPKEHYESLFRIVQKRQPTTRTHPVATRVPGRSATRQQPPEVVAKPPTLRPYVTKHDAGPVPGISAQMARQMFAIAHMQATTNQVAVSELVGLLETNDQRQLSARMPMVWKMGLAERFERDQEHPAIRYRINQAGMEVLRRLKAWPWQNDEQKIPEWAKTLLT